MTHSCDETARGTLGNLILKAFIFKSLGVVTGTSSFCYEELVSAEFIETDLLGVVRPNEQSNLLGCRG